MPAWIRPATQGEQLSKLLLAIEHHEGEGRSLHVLLFGASGEIREFTMEGGSETAGLLGFLQKGYGGGTDFECAQNGLGLVGETETTTKTMS